MTSLPDPTGWLAWWSELWRETYSRTAPLPSLAPQALSQPILPGWLFANSINVTEENSSSPETERKIVAEYSYGRQLGRIIDVLSELIDRWPGGAPDVPSVQRFAELRDDIERIKARSIVRAISELAEMKQRNPDEYARLAPKLREILEVDSDAHSPDGGHRPDADLRPATSAVDPGQVRGPLQRTAPPSQPPALPAPARPPCRRSFPAADQASARPPGRD
jgi:hypothetical protein